MPLEWAYWPVSRQALLPEHVGAAQEGWGEGAPHSPWREPDRAFGVGVLARQQAGPAARARRRRAEGLAEEHALLGEALDVGRPDGVAVGPHPIGGGAGRGG